MQLEEIGSIRHLINYKIKGNHAILLTENEKIKIFLATFNYFKLKINQEISRNLLVEIARYDKREEVKIYLKGLLYKRPYNEKQLYQKALAKFDSPKEVALAMKDLKQSSIVDEKDYIDNYLEYFKKNNYGKYFIMNYFIEQGTRKDFVNKLVFNEDEEKEKARNYFDSVKNKYVGSNFTKQKKKLYDLMILRGFDPEVIIDLLSHLEINTDKERKNLAKDYRKAKIKLSNKFEGSMLESRIVNRLINLGYELPMIREVINEEESKND